MAVYVVIVALHGLRLYGIIQEVTRAVERRSSAARTTSGGCGLWRHTHARKSCGEFCALYRTTSLGGCIPRRVWRETQVRQSESESLEVDVKIKGAGNPARSVGGYGTREQLGWHVRRRRWMKSQMNRDNDDGDEREGARDDAAEGFVVTLNVLHGWDLRVRVHEPQTSRMREGLSRKRFPMTCALLRDLACHNLFAKQASQLCGVQL
ncbi:hypothetical protein C8R44DRAFT_750839 [Mycena epipterygia]|nr:hypothetical protein C8R44DRAFT_750839 [Mycena epipterygia]